MKLWYHYPYYQRFIMSPFIYSNVHLLESFPNKLPFSTGHSVIHLAYLSSHTTKTSYTLFERFLRMLRSPCYQWIFLLKTMFLLYNCLLHNLQNPRVKPWELSLFHDYLICRSILTDYDTDNQQKCSKYLCIDIWIGTKLEIS